MIYTNLFKPNKAGKSKTSLHYFVESRKYRLGFIFEKKSMNIIYGMVIGVSILVFVNLGIYGVTIYSNNGKLKDLTPKNDSYNSSIILLKSKQQQYKSIESNAENIYNMSDKPTKWSTIVSDIAEQLPYDGVLTSIETITQKEALESQARQNDSSSTNTTGASNTLSSGASDNQSNAVNNASGSSESTTGSTSGTATQQAQSNTKKNANSTAFNENTVLLIQGKSLSMVNISLFLDKLDGLQIFSKVECTKAQQSQDADYYEFTIYATLN